MDPKNFIKAMCHIMALIYINKQGSIILKIPAPTDLGENLIRSQLGRQYCKDTWYKLENCWNLQCHLTRDHFGTQGIVAQEVENAGHL